MGNDPPNTSARLYESSTNNYGNRNATYNNNIFNNYHPSERTGPPPARSGIEILADHTAPTALHSSETRNARTACLAGTRVGIVEKLTSWVEDPSKKHRVCWVTGGAGVGKSAIAQTICETSRRQSQLAASFFFSRNDNSRSTLNPFFPTLSHQLATTPAFQTAGLSSFIESTVRQTPNVLLETNLEGQNPGGKLRGSNLEGQFQSLISQPCAQIDAKKWKALPKLIVIDGLDECMGGSGTTSASHAQETLLSIINNATTASPSIPLQFMIFSRPERTIRNFFQTTLSHEPVDTRDFNEEVDRDIRTYLTKEFSALSDSRPEVLAMGGWPTKEARNMLVRKADGHFIYVVTVMKYITSNHPSPADLRERLEIVLHTEETTSHPDLSDLDQLYHTILQRFGNGDLKTKLLLPLLQLMVTPHEFPSQLRVRFAILSRDQYLIAALLKIEFHRCSTLLSQLRSVLHVPDDPHNGDVAVLHASFSDFLGDGQRSHEFQVQPLRDNSYFNHVCCCLFFILKRKLHQHQRGEHIEPEDWRLDLSSLNSWDTIEVVFRPVDIYSMIPSQELLSTVINLDLYEYSNMILDSEWAKKTFRGCQSMNWKEYLAPSLDGYRRYKPQYHKHRIGPAAKRREFFCCLFMTLLNNLFRIRRFIRAHLKSRQPDQSNGGTLRYNFFEDDWLIILPKDEKNRKTSLSRLGCIAALGSTTWPYSMPSHHDAFLKLFPRTARDSWSIASPLKVLPHGDLELAKYKFSGDKFEFCLVRRQQRKWFTEEFAKLIPDDKHLDPPTISTATFDNLVKVLTSTTIRDPQLSEESDNKEVAPSRGVRKLFRFFS
ncbi:hypothetical protein PQX77_013188 [Marasmius sp. AFHP31]|nr:hypothetical protein PQX77_013188 [Marasmius sp. AFHP31]